MINQKDFWEEIFKITEDENRKIIEEGLTGPANILETQLQSIIWHHLKKNNITSITELTYDPKNKRKRLDLALKHGENYYAIEIKRNCIGLEKHGKNYTDSINRFQSDLDKLDTAQTTHKKYKKIFIVIQYFSKNSLEKRDNHTKKFNEFLEKQNDDWRNSEVFEFGGKNSIIYRSEGTEAGKGDVCLTMRVVIARNNEG